MNPKLNEFLAKYPNITILGFVWSIIWRLYVVLFAFVGFLGVVEIIFSN